MDKLQTLIHLVQGLDAGESRHIKKTILGDDGNYLKLVGLIEKRGAEITQHLIEKAGIRAESKTYERLIEKISLSIGLVDEHIEVQQLKKLFLIVQYSNRGCFDYALSKIKELEMHARECENFMLLLLLLQQKEHVLTRLKFKKEVASQLNKIIHEIKETSAKISNVTEIYSYVYKSGEILSANWQFAGVKKVEMEEAKKKLKNLLDTIPLPLSNSAKIIYHRVRSSILSYLTRDRIPVIIEMEEEVGTFTKKEKILQMRAEGYYSQLRRLVEYSAKHDTRPNRTENFYEKLNLLRSNNINKYIKDPGFKLQLLLASVNAEILYMIRSLSFESLNKLEEYHKEILLKNKDVKYDSLSVEELFILFQLSYAHFLNNNLVKSNRCIIQILLREGTIDATPQFLISKVLQTIIAFENEDTELVLSIARSILRNTKHESFPSFPLYLPLLKFLHSNPYKNDIGQEEWKILTKELYQIKKELIDNSITPVGIDIVAWTESKARNITIQQVLKEKTPPNTLLKH